MVRTASSGAAEEDAVGQRREDPHRFSKRNESSTVAAAFRNRRAARVERHGLVPRHDGVRPGRHVVDAVPAFLVRHGEVAVREHEDERAHVRMDVAEDADDARAVEADGLRAACGIAAEIEAARLREREDVVIGAVVVREVHRGARRRSPARAARSSRRADRGARAVPRGRRRRRAAPGPGRPRCGGDRRLSRAGDMPSSAGLTRRSRSTGGTLKSTLPRIVPVAARRAGTGGR